MSAAVWTPVYTAPAKGESPYDWASAYVGECTWGAYYRIMKNGWTPPCYYDKAANIPGYTNAKDWIVEFREPWKPVYISEEPDYVPSAGDILVFDGNFGHVATIESLKDPENKVYIVSDWNRVEKHQWALTEWKLGTQFPKVGKLIGYLHYVSYESKFVTPVERNTSVNQIEATDGTLRVRLAPNLNGEFYCSITPGYYDVLSTVPANAADKAKEPGLKEWYEIEKGKYCANITTKYLPAGSSTFDDIAKLFEELQVAFTNLTKENESYAKRIERAVDILTGKESV